VIFAVTEVVLTRRAQKDLQALDPPVRRRILDRLAELEDPPLLHAVRLSNPRLGTYRIRVGPWRVIFDIDEDVVVVLRIGHRRELYSR
jgi:mRNA interferase RelE/StbE